ncbi:MAG: glucosamine-6-phosphate deaminase [Planctomycetes bacterium]|nr:glucosamine-6-phosphate deaminase [Planctomycetota bacterium]
MTHEHEKPPGRGPRLLIFSAAAQAATAAADAIARLIQSHADQGRAAVLGLATGRSQIGVYAELVARHRAGLSFAGVESFNVDEYYPIAPEAEGSFHAFMRRHFFDHVDLPAEKRHLPDGAAPEEHAERSCRAYEARIQAAGGIDLLLLGLGRSGHIGFNEPGSGRDSRTRVVALHQTTRRDNARDFDGGEAPERAMTMGIETILEARSILLLAFGAAKADVLARALAGPASAELPASFLLEHGDVTVLADEAAAGRTARRAAR